MRTSKDCDDRLTLQRIDDCCWLVAFRDFVRYFFELSERQVEARRDQCAFRIGSIVERGDRGVGACCFEGGD